MIMKKQLTKQELKDKQEKKQRILKFVKRSINIVCYCLSVLFLILCVAVGVQSCNSSKDKTNKLIKRDNNYSLRENTDSNITYYYFDEETVKASWQAWQTSADGFNFGAPHSEDEPYSASCRVWGSMNDVGGDHEFKTVLFRYTVSYVSWTNNPVITLTYISLQNFNIGWSAVVYDEANDIFNNYMFTIDSNIGNIENLNNGSITETENGNFLYFWLGSFSLDTTEAFTFNFNDLINYNGYFNASLSSPYISYSSLSTDIDMPFFISGGNVYNRIHLQFIDAYGSYYLDNTGNVFLLNVNQNIYMTYLYMEYVNTINGLTTLVNTRDYGVHYNGTTSVRYSFNSSSWVSNNYREIKIVEEPDNDLINTLTKFNSNTSNINNGNKYTDVGLGDVFNLLSNSFTALISLFTIQIIPGLTIGLLLFLPLVVTIIILVFKAVKK